MQGAIYVFTLGYSMKYFIQEMSAHKNIPNYQIISWLNFREYMTRSEKVWPLIRFPSKVIDYKSMGTCMGKILFTGRPCISFSVGDSPGGRIKSR